MKLCKWVLIFLLCAASVGRAQYIGTNRPLTVAQAAAMDAAKTDTARFKADSTARTAQINELSGRVDAGGALVQRDSLRLDSLAAAKIGRGYYKAGANVTITTHGAPGDSATISTAGGGGGGGGMPYDTTLYRRILGWPADSALYGAFSGFRLLDNRTARADSATGDSLWSNIDQLKSSGGRILVLPGDTIHDFRGTAWDSLTSGNLTRTVTVQGADRYQCILSGTRNSTGSVVFRFPAGRGAGAGSAALLFREMTLDYNPANSSGISWESGNITFERCKLAGEVLFCPGNATAPVPADSRNISLRECELSGWRVCQHTTKAAFYLHNCIGSVGWIELEGPNVGTAVDSSRFSVEACSLNIARWNTNCNRPSTIQIVGSVIENSIGAAGGNFNLYGELYLSGSLFAVQDGGSTGWEVACSFSTAYVSGCVFRLCNLFLAQSSGWISGCTFYKRGVSCSGGIAKITGCNFYGSVTGVSVPASSVVSACTFTSCTTGASCSGSYTRLHGNHFQSCTTAVSGSWGTDTDNVSW